MNMNRLVRIILVVAMTLTILAVVLGFKPSSVVTSSNPAYTGRGDYQRFEIRQSHQNGQAQELGWQSAGMGDVHRFEAESLTSASAGMGDLHLLEAQLDYTIGKRH